MLRGRNMWFRPAISIWLVFTQSSFKFHKNGDIRKLKAWSFRLLKNDFCRLYNERTRVLQSSITIFLYTLYKRKWNFLAWFEIFLPVATRFTHRMSKVTFCSTWFPRSFYFFACISLILYTIINGLVKCVPQIIRFGWQPSARCDDRGFPCFFVSCKLSTRIVKAYILYILGKPVSNASYIQSRS